MSADVDAHERLRILLGGFALARLDEAEAAEVERHLTTCASCREELAEIAPAVAGLADLRSARGGDDLALLAPSDLGHRVVGGVELDARRGRRTRTLRAAAIAGLAAAVAAVVVVVGLRLTQPDAAPVAAVPLEKVGVSRTTDTIRASAAIVPHTWGVEVKLRARGFNRGERYDVTVQGTDGVSHEAGEFVGTGGKEIDCNLSSSVLRAKAAGFEVRDPAGAVLISSRF